MALYIAGLWRYPVKSLAGERLSTAELEPDGIAGDRLVVVAGPEGVRTSRKQHRLLGLQGTLDAQGRALINGHAWDSDEALRLVKDAAGDDAWLEPAHETNRFDILPLLVATDGAVASFSRDVRRLRPNILIGGVEGMAENDWPGATLHSGNACASTCRTLATGISVAGRRPLHGRQLMFRSMVVKTAALASVLSAASVARTRKVWLPSARPV